MKSFTNLVISQEIKNSNLWLMKFEWCHAFFQFFIRDPTTQFLRVLSGSLMSHSTMILGSLFYTSNFIDLLQTHQPSVYSVLLNTGVWVSSWNQYNSGSSFVTDTSSSHTLAGGIFQINAVVTKTVYVQWHQIGCLFIDLHWLNSAVMIAIRGDKTIESTSKNASNFYLNSVVNWESTGLLHQLLAHFPGQTAVLW